jgi:plastocyanin
MFCLVAMAAFAAVSAAQATVHEVSIVDYQFVPSTLTVTVDDSIHWTNNGQFPHTVTSGENCVADGDFDSGNLNPGDGFYYVADDEDVGRTIDYFCQYHCGMGMVGSYTVEWENPTVESSWGKIKSLYK